jgi:hypothetical protein
MGYIMEGYTGSVDLALFVARIDTIREELWAGDARILDQYHRQGYAFAEVEEESFVNDEKICGPLARSRPLPPTCLIFIWILQANWEIIPDAKLHVLLPVRVVTKLMHAIVKKKS